MNLQIPAGSTNFYSSGFRNLIENHLQYLQTHPQTQPIILSPHYEDVYTGDFFGLLQYLNISQDLFWVVMRVNNLYSPLEYNGDLGIVYLPARSVIENLNTKFMNALTLN